jgi:hypothetical protein
MTANLGKSLAISATLLLAARGGWAQAAAGASVSATPFPAPAGPYAVGTRDYFWIDSSRGEPFTKDPSDQRHIFVQVWYPAASTPPRSRPSTFVRRLSFAIRLGHSQRCST